VQNQTINPVLTIIAYQEKNSRGDKTKLKSTGRQIILPSGDSE
jgi:hypothetical protein